MVPPVISIQADSAPPPLRQPAGRTSSRVHTPPRLRGGREGSTDHSTAARTSARVHTPPRLQGGREGSSRFFPPYPWIYPFDLLCVLRDSVVNPSIKAVPTGSAGSVWLPTGSRWRRTRRLWWWGQPPVPVCV